MRKYRFLGSTTVGTKGQVVIPATAREECSIKEGDKLLILGTPGNNAFIAVKPDVIEQYAEHLNAHLQDILHLTTKNTNPRKP